MSRAEILLESGTNELEILEFFIEEVVEGEEEPVRSYFGVNVAKVMQVIEKPDLKKPEAPPHPSFMGAIPLRGYVLPVIDLGVWLEMEEANIEHQIVIVTEFSQTVAGFLVSGVTDIHRVGWGDVESPSGYMSKMDQSCIVGMVSRENRFIQLIDLERILADLDPDTQGTAANVGNIGQGRNVLIADDSAIIRKLVAETMESAGYSLTIAQNGKEALEALKAKVAKAKETGKSLSTYVDIVLSDIEMPQMDGFSFTKAIRDELGLKDLPVVLYSSLITKELKHKGDSVGATEQVSKPDLGKLPFIAARLLGIEVQDDQAISVQAQRAAEELAAAEASA